MGTKARILVDITVDGISYKPNQLVEFSELYAKQLASAGRIDTAEAAVSAFPASVIVHPCAAQEAEKPSGRKSK